MIDIKSYIKQDEKFIPINEFNDKLDDDFYIYGAIDLNIKGVELINLDMYDLVDQLWAYIINGILELENGKIEFKTNFPDQPLPMSFILNKNSNIITIITKPYDKNIEAKVDYREFVKTICVSAKEFFDKLSKIEINKEVMSKDYLNKIEKLLKKYNI